jgi:6-phospho-beta-glucosidase
MEILTILGGGSAYTPGLLQALIAHGAELPLKTVRLYDTDASRLAIVARLGTAMAQHAGAFRVELAGTLEAAIEGADLVLNTTRPGGLAARRIDETLPLAFNIPGQETVGPGGFFFALRSVPEALRVAATMRALAPRATLLNYTNPSNIVTQALADRGGVNVIGLCDQSDEDLQALCHALQQPARYAFRCNGLNHATWYSDIVLNGEPLAAPPGSPPATEGFDEEHQLRFELSLTLARKNPGFWPNSYLPYYLFPKLFVAQARRLGPRSDVVAASLDKYYSHFAAEGNRANPQLRCYRGSAGFADLAVQVIRALASPTPQELVLNLPNQGATLAFAHDTVIESRVKVSRDGIERLAAPPLPTSFFGLAKRLERYQRLTARAAAGCDLQARIAALAANPLVERTLLAARMLAQAKNSYGAMLPQAA